MLFRFDFFHLQQVGDFSNHSSNAGIVGFDYRMIKLSKSQRFKDNSLLFIVSYCAFFIGDFQQVGHLGKRMYSYITNDELSLFRSS